MISAMRISMSSARVTFLMLSSLAAATAAIPAGGFAGTWTANFAKSTFPGAPPKIDMCTIDPDGTVTVNETSAEGRISKWFYTPVEGQPVHVTGRENTTVTVKKVNARRMEHTWDRNGRPAKSTSVLSEDGQVTVFTIDGTDKDGKPFHEMVVYDKQ
jgi:hypothetical protein